MNRYLCKESYFWFFLDMIHYRWYSITCRRKRNNIFGRQNYFKKFLTKQKELDKIIDVAQIIPFKFKFLIDLKLEIKKNIVLKLKYFSSLYI